MTTVRSVTLLLLISLSYVSQAAYQDMCSYVKVATDMTSTPYQWGFAYPVDICMENVVAGTSTYFKYVCDDADQIKVETWDSATCDSNLLDTQDPTATVEHFSCTTYGDCPYMTVTHGGGGCPIADDYKVEAIIPEVCVEGLQPFDKSFEVSCSASTLSYYTGSSSACGGDVSLADTSSGCTNMVSSVSYAALGYWETSACMSMTYEAPTMNPTMEPTAEPTVEPTSNPSMNPSSTPSESPTRNPSGSPSESPSRNPSASPTDEPTVEPTNGPSKAPSKTPSAMPTMSPSDNPVASETTMAGDGGDDSGASYITLAANMIIAMCLSLATM